MNSGQAKARQSMQSRNMDCFTAFAMTGLFMESEAQQSMTSEGMDRHGLRPRDEGAGSWSACGIGPDTAGPQWRFFVLARCQDRHGDA